MAPEILEAYDFDWTMFRSPFPPVGYSERSWFDSFESLSPPYVPMRPGGEFWIGEVVQELRDAQRRNGTITAVITARREDAAMRVTRLLEQQRLRPDFTAYRHSDRRRDKDVINFKRKQILDVLKIYPSIKRIVLWEDVQEQIDDIAELSKRKKLKFEGNLVTEIENI